MVIIPDMEKAVATIMAKRNAKGAGTMSPAPLAPEISRTENGETDGKHAAAQDLLSSIHNKSAQKMVESLSNFVDMHSLQK